MSKRLYHQFCGVARTLDFVGERWTLLIVRDLLLGPRRYSDLLNELAGITTNLLAKRLKQMERDGLIEKEKIPPPTPAIVYRLTPLGQALEGLVLEACEWGNRLMTAPAKEEKVNLAWSLHRLKALYRGGYQMVFELRGERQAFHVDLLPEEITLHYGSVDDPELLIQGDEASLYEMFFGPASASEMAARGGLVIEGKFGRWPKLVAAFGLR